MSWQAILALLFLVLPGIAKRIELIYSVEYVSNYIEISVQSTGPLNNFQVPNLGIVGANPLIALSSCTPSTPSQNRLLPTSHTFLTVSRLTPSLSTNISSVSLEIPGYLQDASCLEVAIESLWLAAGLIVPSVKKQLSTEHVGMERTNSSEIFCSADHCELVDENQLGWNRVGLVRHTSNNKYSLVNYILAVDGNETLVWHPLPNCPFSRDSLVSSTLTWRRVEANASCDQTFTPTHLHVASKSDVFVSGNGLLYSSDSGLNLYQLTSVNFSTEKIISFAVSTIGRMLAITISQNSSAGLWFGCIGCSLHQLQSSSLLEHILERSAVNLTEASLVFDETGNLYLDTHSHHRVYLPLALLMSPRTGRGFIPTPSHFHPLLHPHLHTLTSSTPHCLYQEVRIEAPVCGQVTRTVFHVDSVEELAWRSDIARAETNCSEMGSGLPQQLFLDKRENYQFRAHFVLSPNISDPNRLEFSTMISDPNVLLVTVSSQYHAPNSMLTLTAKVQERGQLIGQWDPGAVVTAADLSFKVWGADTSCVDVHSSSPLTPDYIRTTVYVGCPPGISLSFDPEMTSSQFDQHCQSTVNISCYYFNHEFRPVFKVVDMTISQESVYSGPYTLRALAGGLTVSSMTEFLPSQQVESGIWTPVNSSKLLAPVYYHGDSAIRWACGTFSPCGEIFPGDHFTSEYYLLLEASNWLVSGESTYCHLSVRFLIRIHGLGMGVITTVVSLVVFIVLLSLLVLAMFLCWLQRLKFIYWRDLLVECQGERWAQAGRRLTELVTRHKLKSGSNSSTGEIFWSRVRERGRFKPVTGSLNW